MAFADLHAYNFRTVYMSLSSMWAPTMQSCWKISAILTAFLCCSQAAFAVPQKESGSSQRKETILQIQTQIENHDLLQAQRLLVEAARKFPSDAGFENLQGVVAAQQGDYATAQSSFREAIVHDPRLTAAYLNLGRLYQQASTTDPEATGKALDVYRRVLAYDASNAEANYQSATLLLRQGQYEDSLKHLMHLPLEIRMGAQATSVACADEAGLGDRQRTDEACDQIFKSADFSEEDAQQAVPGLLVGKRDDLVVSLFQNLQKRQSLSPEGLHTLALAYERTNNFVEARASLEQSATRNLTVPILLELARIAHKEKDYKGSLGYLAHARDLEPDSARLHYYFGLVCLDLDLVAEARNSLEKAVKLDSENPSYNYAMGVASTFRQDPEEAVPFFEKYLKLMPEDPRGKLAIGVVLWRAKNYDASIPWLKQALNTPATATPAHYYLGAIAVHQRRFEEARHELEQALKAQPDYTDALAQLGQYYLELKDFKEAERQLSRALQIDPSHYSANFYLLTLYKRTGDLRREAQEKRFEELRNLLDEKKQELLRIVEVQPFETP
jgi:tetratricopeptide (TPR) repeat protein